MLPWRFSINSPFNGLINFYACGNRSVLRAELPVHLGEAFVSSSVLTPSLRITQSYSWFSGTMNQKHVKKKIHLLKFRCRLRTSLKVHCWVPAPHCGSLWEAVESLRGRAQKKVMRSLRPHSEMEVMKFSQELNAPYKNRMLSKEQDDFWISVAVCLTIWSLWLML